MMLHSYLLFANIVDFKSIAMLCLRFLTVKDCVKFLNFVEAKSYEFYQKIRFMFKNLINIIG